MLALDEDVRRMDRYRGRTTGDAVFFDLPSRTGRVSGGAGAAARDRRATPYGRRCDPRSARNSVAHRRGRRRCARRWSRVFAGKIFVALQLRLPHGGSAMWSGWYGASITALSVAITLACLTWPNVGATREVFRPARSSSGRSRRRRSASRRRALVTCSSGPAVRRVGTASSAVRRWRHGSQPSQRSCCSLDSCTSASVIMLGVIGAGAIAL